MRKSPYPLLDAARTAVRSAMQPIEWTDAQPHRFPSPIEAKAEVEVKAEPSYPPCEYCDQPILQGENFVGGISPNAPSKLAHTACLGFHMERKLRLLSTPGGPKVFDLMKLSER